MPWPLLLQETGPAALNSDKPALSSPGLPGESARRPPAEVEAEVEAEAGPGHCQKSYHPAPCRLLPQM